MRPRRVLRTGGTARSTWRLRWLATGAALVIVALVGTAGGKADRYVVPPNERLVFAHYFPPYPISLDNMAPNADYYAKSYLEPNGEGGIHTSYGGLLRDRPAPREPRSGADWRSADLEEEVRAAISGGIDGFSVDILSSGGAVPSLLLDAAHAVNSNFKIMLMPDMSGGLGNASATELAAQMTDLGSRPSAFRLRDGRLVVSPFNADHHPASWWADFVAAMRTAGTDVALVPVLLDSTKISEYAPISYGLSEWGSRSPPSNQPGGPAEQAANAAHSLGNIWMMPVSIQDARPRGRIFDEANNTENLRATWQLAIDTKSEWVQLVTWNDYSEGTAFAPSAHHGSVFLDINRYYASWFRAGAAPEISTDRFFLTHRTQFAAAVPTAPDYSPMTQRAGSAPARDTVEALTFFVAPTLLTIDVGDSKYSCEVAAGVDTCVVPLEPGMITASATRDGNAIASARSPFQVVTDPAAQDLDYFAIPSVAAS